MLGPTGTENSPDQSTARQPWSRLAWAFSEAAEYARRNSDHARSFFNRKATKTNKAVAYSALAHKLARAAYYIMRDQVDFDEQKLFA